MGVYIKDMEMPTSCDECRIMMLEDTNCEAELYCGCPIVFKAHPQGVGHRPDYCPLVPVPPHGRLIDADEFLKRAIGTKCFRGDCALMLEELVGESTTIIPASEEGE